ncbi:MAG: OadG family transporter subunit [Christensenellales bacterium]
MGALTPWWMVIILGMGTVMIGLELLVVLCNLLRVLFHKEGQSAPAAAPQPAAVVAQPVGLERQRLLAAVTAAIAEAEGSDAPGFKIVSFVRR